jgi:protein-S-isoprenylcysteine O-methyltransferase Ste14
VKFQKVARRIRVPLGFVFAALFLWRAQPTLRSILWSLVAVLPGLALRAYSSGYVNKNEELATSGPYAYTRNPLYLGSLIFALGFIGAARSWLLLICFVLLFAVIYTPTILSEEAWLRQKFPSCDDYCRRVPRLLPRLTPADSASHGSFSPALYRKHREYNSLIGAAAVYCVLLLKWWLLR